MKSIPTGSVLKRYQTSLCAQCTITLLGIENFHLIFQTDNVQKAPRKITLSGVHLPKKKCLSYFVGMVQTFNKN